MILIFETKHLPIGFGLGFEIRHLPSVGDDCYGREFLARLDLDLDLPCPGLFLGWHPCKTGW